MKASIFSILLFVFWHGHLNAQLADCTPNDTLKFYHRTGGKLDTFDLTFCRPYTNLPVVGFANSSQLFTTDFLRKSPSLFSFTEVELPSKKTISALPHVGFFYSFGLKGTQALHADYQQTFKKNTLLNLEVDRQSSAGFAINNKYSQNKISFGLYHKKKRNQINWRMAYGGQEIGLYSGIIDTLQPVLNDNPFPLIPVLKPNASSIQKRFNSHLEWLYNMGKDSSQLQVGPLVELKYTNWNRQYFEGPGSLNEIYSQINIDSNDTRDQFQDAKLLSGLGAFISNNHFSLRASATHRYWRFQNLGTNRDTNEFGVHTHFLYRKKWLAIESDIVQNIIGAEQEMAMRNQVKIGNSSKYVGLHFNYQNLLPELVQRFYFANNLKYQVTDLKKQTRSDFGLSGAISFWKLDVQARTGILNWNNNLVWTDSLWSVNNKSQLNAFYLETKAHLDFNVFHFYPSVFLQNGNEFLPQAIVSGRFLIKGKVFKAKKLELLFALDPQINSTAKFLSYNTLLDNYYFDDQNRSGGVPFVLHSTFSMAIDEFRFFVRAEQIQNLWTKRGTEINQNYYQAPFLLRLGLSWDFFN